VSARTVRTIARTLLRPTELKRRDTPAWWSIAAPVLAGGTPGSTAATITGGLTLNPEHEATNGVVTVWADSPVQAATLALAGTVYSKYADHDRAHAFGSDTVGYLASDHKSFLVTGNGSGGVNVALEDMAGDPDADWDYNDQTWDDLPTNPTTGPILFEGDFNWTGDFGDVAVHERVEAIDETTTKWNFHVRNVSFRYGSGLGDGESLGRLTIPGQWADVVTIGGTNVVWTGPDDSLRSGEPGIGWGYRPQMRIGGAGDFWFTTHPLPVVATTGQASNEPNFAWAEGEARAPGKPITAMLQSVQFSGGGNFAITADPGDKPYAAGAQWYDRDADGRIDAKDAAQNPIDHAVPVGYARKTRVTVAATFLLAEADRSRKSAFVRADGPGDYDLPWKLANVINGVLVLTASKLAVDLDNKVDYISDFKLSWEVSIGRPTTPFENTSGESTNEFFATLAMPTTPPIPATAPDQKNYGVMITPLWAFCQEASGSTENAGATEKAFNAFAYTDFATHKDLDPLRNINSRDLYYYKEWDTPVVNAVELLRRGDGQCGAWTNMFRSMLLEGGVPQSTFSNQQVTPITGKFMLINSWTFSPNGTASYGKYTNINEYRNPSAGGNGSILSRYAEKVAGQWQYKWGAVEEVHDELGLPGQNNSNPPRSCGQQVGGFGRRRPSGQ